ncbi:hypothetical protein ACVTW2_000658 [Escherichia coli]
MIDNKSILLLQQKAIKQLLAITEDTPVIRRAELLGRAEGLIAALKYIADEQIYESLQTLLLEVGVKYVMDLGRTNND